MIYWTNDFTRKSFSAKTNEIDGKLTIILRTDETKFFERLKKLYTKWVVQETMNDRNKRNRTRPSPRSSTSYLNLIEQNET